MHPCGCQPDVQLQIPFVATVLVASGANSCLLLQRQQTKCSDDQHQQLHSRGSLHIIALIPVPFLGSYDAWRLWPQFPSPGTGPLQCCISICQRYGSVTLPTAFRNHELAAHTKVERTTTQPGWLRHKVNNAHEKNQAKQACMSGH
jgi:hypothetical protein